MEKNYVHYGCGLSAPAEWINYDASPTLRVQKIPLIGSLIKNKLNVIFPVNVKYGNIIKGLPVKDNSCNGVYCSHILEHLSLEDFRKALKNTYKILKEGGVFRCIVPDLEVSVREYIKSLDNGEKDACLKFLGSETLLGTEKRYRGLKGLFHFMYSNKNHLWMWDKISLIEELKKAGFSKIRTCSFNDSDDIMFKLVENAGRFNHSVAVECVK